MRFNFDGSPARERPHGKGGVADDLSKHRKLVLAFVACVFFALFYIAEYGQGVCDPSIVGHTVEPVNEEVESRILVDWDESCPVGQHGAGPNGRKRVFVTGGAGFVGFHLQRRLHERGDCVMGFDNFSHLKGPIDAALKDERADILKHELGLDVIRGDLCDRDALKRLFEKFRFTHVVNLAAEAGVRASVLHPNLYVKSNVDCFVHLLETVRHYPHIKVAYASSSSVYGQNKKTPFSEFDRVDAPASVYAATKKENELLAAVYHHQYNVSLTGMRFFTVYGPMGRADMAYFHFTDSIARGKPVTVYSQGELKRDFTYVQDIVSGIVAIIDLGAPLEVFNLGNNTPVTIMTFLRAIEKALGKQAQIDWKPKALGDVDITYADLSHAQARLGYQPTTDIEQGMAIFVEWYKAWAVKYYANNPPQ